MTEKHRTRVRASGVWYLTDMPVAEWRSILGSSDTVNDVYNAIRESSGARGLVTRKYVAAVEEFSGDARPLHERVDEVVPLLARTLDVLNPDTGRLTADGRKASYEAVAGAITTLRVGP